MGYVVFQVYSKLLLKTVLEHYIIDCDYLIAWLPRDQVKIVTLTDSCPKRYIFCNKTVGITITWWSCEQRCLIGIVSQSHYATLYNLLHRLAASDCATVVAACLPASFLTFNCAPYSSSTHDAAIVAPYSIGVVGWNIMFPTFFISDNRKGTLREGTRYVT